MTEDFKIKIKPPQIYKVRQFFDEIAKVSGKTDPEIYRALCWSRAKFNYNIRWRAGRNLRFSAMERIALKKLVGRKLNIDELELKYLK